ncbi:MAG: hypothetical protein Q4E73_10450 [Lachnospiraceae bacterium]|nr:hypothetical protein [Lachnospiraceae bacterium]
MSTIEKNRFSQLLENLLCMAEIKNASLAKALQYDVSYISKWCSGRMLPAEKNKRKILVSISRAIITQCSETGLMNLYENYRVASKDILERVIFDNLEAEYNYVQDTQKTYGTTIAPKTIFLAELSPAQYITKMHHPVLRRVSNLHIMAQMDLLSLMHEYRLQIIQGNIRRDGYRDYPDVHFSLMIDLAEDKIDYNYDPIFLLNMISDMARIDFHLYTGNQAAGRMIFAVKDDFMISGMLADSNRCISVAISSEADNCNLIYDSIQNLCTREMLLFRKTAMHDMIENNDYTRSILSLNQRWILGHLTEHLLPDDLFEELIEQQKSDHHFDLDEEKIRYLHMLTQKMLEETTVDIIIYSTAFSNLAIENELDFFDKKIHLTLSQRKRYIEHLFQLCQERNNLTFKLIYGRFVSDFQYDITQCVFLSDSISYIRLNTKNGKNNLILLNHANMLKIFYTFFDNLWTGTGVTIFEEKTKIHTYLFEMLQRLNLIARVENTSTIPVK